MINPRGTRRRLALSVLAVFAIVAVFLVRLIDIQVVRADELRQSADERRTSTVTTYGARGSIVDANGKVLASSVDRFDITAAPEPSTLGVHADRDRRRQEGRDQGDAAGGGRRDRRHHRRRPDDPLTALTDDPESDFTYLAKAVKLDVFNQVKAPRHPVGLQRAAPVAQLPERRHRGQPRRASSAPTARRRESRPAQDACLDETERHVALRDERRRRPDAGQRGHREAAGRRRHAQLTIDSDLNWFVQQVLAEQGTTLGADWATAMVVRVSDGADHGGRRLADRRPQRPGRRRPGSPGRAPVQHAVRARARS